MDAARNIFGTQFLKGWIVFKLSPDGSGGWTPTVIYTFNHKGDRAHKVLSRSTRRETFTVRQRMAANTVGAEDMERPTN